MVIAASKAGESPGAAMLMFATAGLIRCAVIQSTAAMRSDICPPPEQGSTRTEWTKAFFAVISLGTDHRNRFFLESCSIRDIFPVPRFCWSSIKPGLAFVRRSLSKFFGVQNALRSPCRWQRPPCESRWLCRAWWHHTPHSPPLLHRGRGGWVPVHQ